MFKPNQSGVCHSFWTSSVFLSGARVVSLYVCDDYGTLVKVSQDSTRASLS